MSENTKIEWCTHTQNFWEGCQPVGPGCDHCYAEARNARFGGGVAVNWGPDAPRRRTSEANWKKPLVWNANHETYFAEHGRRQSVFCSSLSDWADNAVPDEWRMDAAKVMLATPNLDWLLLTKRIGNAAKMLATMFPQGMPSNVWIGATIVNQEEADRDIPKLLAVPAAKRFVSMEPLLGPVNLAHLNEDKETNEVNCLQPFTWDQEVAQWRDTEEDWEEAFEDHYGKRPEGLTGPMHPGVDWVIVGGESGPGARPMHPDWALSLLDQCAAAGVPFFFKQWGEWSPFINEAHFTHAGKEKHAHAWVDAETADHGKCWLIDDDGAWSNWTGNPRKLPEGEEDDTGGNLVPSIRVMGHLGKKAAGRLLNDRTWDGYPA